MAGCGCVFRLVGVSCVCVCGGRWDGYGYGERSEQIESNGASGMYRMRQSMDDGSGGELGEAS